MFQKKKKHSLISPRFLLLLLLLRVDCFIHLRQTNLNSTISSKFPPFLFPIRSSVKPRSQKSQKKKLYVDLKVSIFLLNPSLSLSNCVYDSLQGTPFLIAFQSLSDSTTTHLSSKLIKVQILVNLKLRSLSAISDLV